MSDSARMEEFLQLEADNNRMRSKISMLEQWIEECEKEMSTSTTHKGPTEKEKELEKNVNQLRQRLSEQNTEIDILTISKTTLESKIETLKEELNNFIPPRPATPENNEQLENSRIKIKELINKLNDLESHHFNLGQELHVREAQQRELEAEIRGKDERIDELIQDGKEQHRVIGDLREQIHELEAELAESRLGGHAARGNSMFAEFVDERKKIEKDLRTLHAQMTKCRRDNLLLRQELEDANRRARIFSVKEVKGRCRCSSLELEMNIARGKVSTLEYKIREFGERVFENVMEVHGKLPSDLIFLKSEHVRLTSENEQLRKERNKAVDDMDIIAVKLDRAQNIENSLREKIDMLEMMVNSYREQVEELMNGNREPEVDSEKELINTEGVKLLYEDPISETEVNLIKIATENESGKEAQSKCLTGLRPMIVKPIHSEECNKSVLSSSLMAPPMCTPAKFEEMNKTFSTPATMAIPAQDDKEERERQSLLLKSYAIQHRERLKNKKTLTETPLKPDINIAIKAEQTPAQKKAPGQRPPRAKPLLNPARGAAWKTIVLDFKEAPANSVTPMKMPLKTPLTKNGEIDADEPLPKKAHIEQKEQNQENILLDMSEI